MMMPHGSLLSPFEIEHFVQSLQTLPLSQTGSSMWHQQHQRIASLNQQAHLDAQMKHDEFVLDCLVLHDKLSTLLHELISIEAFHAHVLPLLVKNFKPKHTLRAYLLLYYEVVIVNLLEVAYFHRHVVEASGDHCVDLSDYCQRKIVQLNTSFNLNSNSRASSCPDERERDAKPDRQQSEAERNMREYSGTLSFACSSCAVSILRYLTDHLALLPLSLTSRLLHDQDILLAIVPLLLNSPFTRRVQRTDETNQQQKQTSKWVTEKFIDAKWQEVRGDDSVALCTNEVQLWLIVANLLLTPQCRASYSFNTTRQENLLRLRPLLNMQLLDQLPLLADVKRFIEELAIITPPAPTSSVVIELIPEIYTRVTENRNWEDIAKQQMEQVFSEHGMQQGEKDTLDVWETYASESLSTHMSDPTCAQCQNEADKRCSYCQRVWYCGRECQVKHWKTHKAACEEHRAEKAKREEKRQAKLSAKAVEEAANTGDSYTISYAQGEGRIISSSATKISTYGERKEQEEFIREFRPKQQPNAAVDSIPKSTPLIEVIDDGDESAS